MNVATFFLAAFLATHTPIDGPVIATAYKVAILDGDKPPVVAPGPSEGAVLALPDELVKQGWVCVLTKRTERKGMNLQSVVCRYGQEKAPVKFSGTALCSTQQADVDEQRLMIGTDQHAVGIMLTCMSLPVIDAKI